MVGLISAGSNRPRRPRVFRAVGLEFGHCPLQGVLIGIDRSVDWRRHRSAVSLSIKAIAERIERRKTFHRFVAAGGSRLPGKSPH
jgi:hypothetical protein